MNTPVTFPGSKTRPWAEADYEPVRLGLGILTIRTGAGPGRKVYEDRYLVREDPYPDGAHIFILTKAPGETRYGCAVNPDVPNGRGDGCDCNGWASGGTCKHCRALRALIKAGHIDKPETSRV